MTTTREVLETLKALPKVGLTGHEARAIEMLAEYALLLESIGDAPKRDTDDIEQSACVMVTRARVAWREICEASQTAGVATAQGKCLVIPEPLLVRMGESLGL